MFGLAELAKRTQGDPREMLRARAVIDRDGVSVAESSPAGLVAKIAAWSDETASEYMVTIGPSLDGSCTCIAYASGKRPFCKHMLAVAIHWLEGPQNVTIEVPWLAPLADERIRALHVLAAVTAGGGERSTSLLLPPRASQTSGWFIDIPGIFRDALDLATTTFTEHGRESAIWLQGASFKFKEGDLLHNGDRTASDWAGTMRTLTVALQVQSATSAAPGRGDRVRNAGHVRARILRPDDQSTRLVPCGWLEGTQDDLVRALIAGIGLE